jgi:hypothetical protein
VARPAGLIAWLLPGVVLLAHVAAVDWLARQRELRSVLPALPPVLYTRLLQPVVPAAVQVPAQVAVAAASPPSRAAPPARAKVLAPQPEAAVAAIAAPVVAEPAPEVLEVTASPAVPVPDALPAEPPPDPWPADTRLTYRLEGQYRGGPIYGDAWVHWQREGDRYTARLQLQVRFFGSVHMTSQGKATPHGLVPRAFEEVSPGQRRVARLGEQVVALERGQRAVRPPGLQDAVSQFVELGHRFSTGRDVLAVGRSVSFPMARPDGVDDWTYDVLRSERLETPELGSVEAFHLKPRPIAHPRGDITAEMWFAPSLQYLPVRIQVLLGDGAFIDLVVRTIEQR